MQTITLSDGGSHAIGDKGLLKIEVYPVGGAATNLRLTVTGDGVRVTAPNNTLAIVTEIPTDATIGVTTVDGADFDIDQSVRVTVTHAGEATVEFPVVRVGGVPEKTLGTVTRSGESLVLNAFGSSVATDLPRPVMAVASALRTRLTTTPSIRKVHIVADTGAALRQVVTPGELEAAVTVTRGIATILRADSVDVTTSAGPLGQRSPAALSELVAAAADADRTRVGASSLPSGASADELTVYLTTTPVRGMVTHTARSLILVLGPTATAEEQLYASSPDQTPTTGVLPVTPDLADALAAGDAAAFAPGATAVAGVLGARVTEVAR
ncbi:hypothetical protein [Corynebacterium variabile]|uniref:Uncharacterized protein n=1 Tax=Corynebacterium variabile (strain DSM 44702 / CIP 107183 / JCM 12073 / NCIMB 30131) TaxID=858619 RepID=G0HHA5_CORVD|nr:hypothetical protein [Corynebacterium variabile]AEK38255.1 hypothetical protein CVAR_2914 [Corynebacterium variabile DSM 44702]